MIEKNKVALIKRAVKGMTYYVFPGGGIEINETPEAAAKREAFEELGLNVNIKDCLATVHYNGIQYFFLGEITGGVFGAGTGDEYNYRIRNRGTYQPVWIDIHTLSTLDVRPKEIAKKVQSLQGRKCTVSEKEKIFYERGTEELKLKTTVAQKLVRELNHCDIEDEEKKDEIVRELFGSVGEKPSLEANFQCDLGYNIHVGDHFYAGYNCTILDMAEVRVGDNCMIGPNVGIYTAGHSITPKDRNKTGFAIPITIGNDVWIGGSCVILAGVTIGDHSVVAAGSVVTKDVPPDTVVAGNPARVIKSI
ncbi:DapH/DapD/GlmU-related protein [Fictibacillus enclensis]|uniref:DapH/DapD/GlmU-related protein n=1 Tax=Fictibacillus enclensis TaxID=1017270 RepID=UPI0025A044FE|nr:DapH/DapD/GlmU-related protein [Fictibacillus enclensis]MDM5336328.1 DapH/DapD/GlmU-related protein [Fictibacillus enclensis]